MKPSTPNRVARAAGSLAVLAGLFGSSYLLGAFGPVSRWTEHRSDGTVRTGTESGIDYLLGSTGGNAPVLFFWAMVLLVLVSLAALAVRAERRRVVWALAAVGGVVTLVGIMSIGWVFALPTLFLLVSAALFTLDARRGPPSGRRESPDASVE